MKYLQTTPGPWKVTDQMKVTNAMGGTILLAAMNGCKNRDEFAANSVLAAQSPMMFALLSEALEWIKSYNLGTGDRLAERMQECLDNAVRPIEMCGVK